MKFFQVFRKQMHILGIMHPNQLQQKSIDWRNKIPIISMCQFSILGVVYFLFEANDFKKYSDSFYIASTALLYTIMFSLFTRKTTELYELIDEFEKVTEKR